MKLGLGFSFSGQGAAPDTSFVLADHAGAEVDWKYETASDIVLDVAPDVTQLVNRVSGKNNPEQLVAATMGHDTVTFVHFGSFQYADYTFTDIASVDNYLIVVVMLNSITSRVRTQMAILHTSGTTEAPQMAGGVTDTEWYHGVANISGLTSGEYAVHFAGLLDGEQFYGTKGITAGGDGSINYNTTGNSFTNFSGIRIGHSGNNHPYANFAAVGFLLGGVTLSDIQGARDEYYDWGISQGLIT